MDDDFSSGTDFRWAVNADPDVLVVQLPVVPVRSGDGARDAMKVLLARRGFRPVVPGAELDLRPSNGCLLTRQGPAGAELLVTVGQVGASRFPLTGLDPAWLERAVETGHVGVLVADAAVREDGTTSAEALRRDAEAGGVLAALVPCADADDPA